MVGCSSKLQRMNSAMEPFMTENFPEATFEIAIKDNLYQLIIKDPANQVNENSSDELMTKTLGQFYMVFYKYSNSAAPDTELEIIYENETSTWQSGTYALDDLSNMYLK